MHVSASRGALNVNKSLLRHLTSFRRPLDSLATHSKMALQEVLLIGSSGILAPHLIKSLSTCPQVSLTVLSRSQPKSPTQNAQFVSLPTPYKNEELAEVVKGKDAIINLVPPGQFDLYGFLLPLYIVNQPDTMQYRIHLKNEVFRG